MRRSAHCFLQERADPRLVGGGQLPHGEGRGPHAPFVEGRLVAEANRSIPRLEFLRALKETDHLAVLRVCWHPVPELWREDPCTGSDDGMESFAQGRDPARASRRSL